MEMKEHQRSPFFTPNPARRFVITPDDMQILATVAHHGVVHSDQIARRFAARSSEHLNGGSEFLFDGGYLARPRSQRDHPVYANGARPAVYTLTRRGAQHLAAHAGIEARPVAANSTRLFLEHGCGVSDIMIAFELAVLRRDHLRLIPFEEIRRTLAPVGTARDYWKVSLVWKGKRKVLHPEPDRLFGIHDRDRPDGRNRKFSCLEFDTGSMPIERATLDQTSILRKFIAYSETHRQGLLEKILGLPNFRVYFVAQSRARIDHMIECYRRHESKIGRAPALSVR